jgi:GTP-binding protein
MSRDFVIGFVGRPNVGKSSIFNAVLGYRRTIVLDQPGTTRDAVVERLSSVPGVAVMDSQGIWDENDVGPLVDAIRRANALVFVTDAGTGVTPFDRWIAAYLRSADKPVLLFANKCDVSNASPEEFAELGFGPAVAGSAVHRRGLAELDDWMRSLAAGAAPAPEESDCLALEEEIESAATLGEEEPGSAEQALEDDDEAPELSGNEDSVTEDDEPIASARDGEALAVPPGRPLEIALLGRPNAGKSTLMNRLCGEAVSRVSPEPLTTRDPVSFEIVTDEGVVRLLDTAGLRRPRAKKEQVEVYASQFTTRAIESADVLFLLLPCDEPMTDQDMRLLSLIERSGKPFALLLSRCDLRRPAERKAWWEESEFSRFLDEYPRLAVSGKTGQGVDKILPLAFKLRRDGQKRIKTSELNQFVEDLKRRNPPPSRGNRAFNLLYASQVRTRPPTFVFFMNRRERLPEHYRRYLENALRDKLRLKGQPIRVLFRGQDR